MLRGSTPGEAVDAFAMGLFVLAGASQAQSYFCLPFQSGLNWETPGHLTDSLGRPFASPPNSDTAVNVTACRMELSGTGQAGTLSMIGGGSNSANLAVSGILQVGGALDLGRANSSEPFDYRATLAVSGRLEVGRRLMVGFPPLGGGSTSHQLLLLGGTVLADRVETSSWTPDLPPGSSIENSISLLGASRLSTSSLSMCRRGNGQLGLSEVDGRANLVVGADASLTVLGRISACHIEGEASIEIQGGVATEELAIGGVDSKTTLRLTGGLEEKRIARIEFCGTDLRVTRSSRTQPEVFHSVLVSSNCPHPPIVFDAPSATSGVIVIQTLLETRGGGLVVDSPAMLEIKPPGMIRARSGAVEVVSGASLALGHSAPVESSLAIRTGASLHIGSVLEAVRRIVDPVQVDGDAEFESGSAIHFDLEDELWDRLVVIGDLVHAKATTDGKILIAVDDSRTTLTASGVPLLTASEPLELADFELVYASQRGPHVVAGLSIDPSDPATLLLHASEQIGIFADSFEPSPVSSSEAILKSQQSFRSHATGHGVQSE